MTKTRRAILDLLSEGSLYFDEIYSILKIKGIVKGLGFNRWNLAKSLRGLIDNDYIYTVTGEKGKVYILAVDGKIYLNRLKIMEDL